MDAPWGLRGRVAAHPAQTWPDETFVTATLATAFADTPLPQSGHITWRGALVAPRAGRYRLAFVSDAKIRVALDGLKPTDPGTFSTLLSKGSHSIEVTMTLTAQRPTFIRWLWVPPKRSGGIDRTSAWSVVPPSVLRPTTAPAAGAVS
jgi:hypothetical protein